MGSVLVIGASGAVGRFLLPRLRAQGAAVVALSRDEQPSRDGVVWLHGALGPALAAPLTETLFCVGPLDHFVDWLATAATPALRRVVALSSMSADSKRESDDPAERALAARLAAAERRLAELAAARGFAWTVLRPTLIYGAGVDRSLSPIVRLARRTRLFPRLPGATGLRQPVHADDIAAACIAAAAGAADGLVVPIGGGERLSFAAMLDRVRAGLNWHTVTVPVGINVLRGLSRLGGRGGAMVQRLTHDLVADNSLLEHRLGVSPRPFHPGPDCWQAGNAG